MSTLFTNYARAYVNWGRWVADCPVRCGGALSLSSGQATFACPECRSLSQIDWPANVDEIWAALQERPAPKFQNWFPSGHELALRANCPDGQTPAQLRDETAEYMGA
jgi:hypothetical protein